MLHPNGCGRPMGHPKPSQKLTRKTNGGGLVCLGGFLLLFLLFVGGAFVEDGDITDVGAGFGEGRDAAVFGDHVGAGVVGGEGEGQIVVVLVEEVAEVVRAGVDILTGIENIGDLIFRGGGGEKLHEATGLFAGDRVDVEIGFGGDDAADEISVEIVFAGGIGDKSFERRSAGGERLSVGGEHVLGIDGENVAFRDGEAASRHGEDEGIAVVSVGSDVDAFAGAEDSVV